MEYAAPVWDPYRQPDIKVLEEVQRLAARYLYNDYTTSTNNVQKSAHSEPSIRNYKTSIDKVNFTAYQPCKQSLQEN